MGRKIYRKDKDFHKHNSIPESVFWGNTGYIPELTGSQPASVGT